MILSITGHNTTGTLVTLHLDFLPGELDTYFFSPAGHITVGVFLPHRPHHQGSSLMVGHFVIIGKTAGQPAPM